jgi:FADH2 O2-dependent halogenase
VHSQEHVYDVAIVGGGIGGTTLASILAQQGVDVLLIEGGTHPRFTIGESTVPETTFGLRVLASRYDVPELRMLSSYGEIRQNVATTCGVKRNFSFVHHTRGQQVAPEHITQMPTWGPPLGPDSHLFRQDTDAWLYQVALSYGATGFTATPVTDVDLREDGVTLTTPNRTFEARYLVDAGGMRALVPDKLGLREQPSHYRTRSRSIFTHLVDVKPFDEVAPPRSEHGQPSPFGQGTLHHMFDGGWMWVIPFDNHPTSTNRLCSVGINLDLDRFPVREDVTPEEEFWEIIERFPDVARQFEHARSVRPFVSSRRSQFSSTQLLGDRWILLPHASDFIDPLFSSGLSVTVNAINALAHRLVDAVRQDDFRSERFAYVEEWVKRSYGYFDELVACSYTAFRDPELWNAWFRVWVLGSTYGTNALNEAAARFERSGDPADFEVLEQAPYRGVQGIDFPPYATLFERASQVLRAVDAGDVTVRDAIAQLYQLLRASQLAPSTFGIDDPQRRHPAGTFTLLPITRILLWGKFRAPEHVRGRYFTGGAPVVIKELAQATSAEVSEAASGMWHLARDVLFSGNRDWKKPRKLPVARAPRPLSAQQQRERRPSTAATHSTQVTAPSQRAAASDESSRTATRSTRAMSA